MALSSPRRQRGLALLMAMLIVVIATTVAVSIVHEEKITIRKNAHIQQLERSGLYAEALEDFARIFLRDDQENSNIDHLDEDWAQDFANGAPIEGGFITGTLEDEQGRFNLNSLKDSEIALSRFKRLCDNLEVDDQFIPALIDWLDEDFDITYPDGMEENYEGYRVANRIMTDVSELLLVHNVTVEIYDKLEPYVTVLPETSTINVNTMSEVIFLSLAPDLDVTNFIEERSEEPFESVADFVSRLQIPVEEEGLSVDTRFFRARGQVVQGEQPYYVNSLIYRSKEGETRILRRTLGQF